MGSPSGAVAPKTSSATGSEDRAGQTRIPSFEDVVASQRDQKAVSSGREAAREFVARHEDPLNASSSPASNRYPVTAFTDLLAEHSNDPDWQTGFFDELGTERVAELIAQAANPISFADPGLQSFNDAAYRENLHKLSGALDGAYENGALDDATFNNLYANWRETNNGQIPPQIADLAANSRSSGFREAFAEQALGDWRAADPGSADAEAAAAAVTHVLGGSFHSQRLDVLADLESSGELDQFLGDAIAGSHVSTSSHEFGGNPQATRDLATPLTNDEIYGDVTSLFEAVNNEAYTHNTYTPGSVPRFTSAQLGSISNSFFDAGAEAFRSNSVYEDNPDFKDAMTYLLDRNFDSILGANINDNNLLDSEFLQDLTTFSQHVMFGNPPGSRQSLATSVVADKIGELVELAESGHPSDAVQIDGRPVNENTPERLIISREDAAAAAGALYGASINGYEAAVGEAAAADAQRQAAANFVVDLAFALIPAVPDSAGNFVKATFGETGQRAFDHAQGLAESEGKEFLSGELAGSGNNIDAAGFDTLGREIGDEIRPDVTNDRSEENDLFSVFQDGISKADDAIS